jgi:cation transporter-like permease
LPVPCLLLCRRDTVGDLVRARAAWLLVFFVGLMLAAVVVEAFESVLRDHVQLSYFVPLLIGHGGNTGSQSNATVIRALALGHLRASDWAVVVWKVRGGRRWRRVQGRTRGSCFRNGRVDSRAEL